MGIAFTLPGTPVTKKNSQRIISVAGHPKIIPSKQYKQYEEMCGWNIPAKLKGAKIASRINLKCLYFMPTRRRVDLVNLLEATCDILVHYGVIADDNCNIVVSHDGSRVLYDKQHPRVEIKMEEAEK